MDGAKYFENMIQLNPLKSLTELNLSGVRLVLPVKDRKRFD